MTEILVLGVGNILMADDGIGPAAVAMLQKNWIFPENVMLADGGTQGSYLLPLVMDCSHLLVIDAVEMHSRPGNVYFLGEQDLKELWTGNNIGVHDAAIPELLASCSLLDRKPETVNAIGIQPENTEMTAKLSRSVKNSLPRICSLVINHLEKLGIETCPGHNATPANGALQYAGKECA